MLEGSCAAEILASEKYLYFGTVQYTSIDFFLFFLGNLKSVQTENEVPEKVYR